VIKVNKFEKLMTLTNMELFRLLTGVTKEVFLLMLAVLTDEYERIHKEKGGNPKGTPVGLKLVIALEYWREYRAMRQMAFDYNMPVSTLCECILWVENVLSKSKDFQIQDLKEKFKHREDTGNPIRIVLIDVEEQPIERPSENQENHYSGKKKRHTAKYQLVVDAETLEILHVYKADGTEHDFTMLKNSILDEIGENVKILADSGYQGIKNFHENAEHPIKKPKNRELTEEEKRYNKELSQRRIFIEHVNRRIKIFRICKEVYRNKGNRMELRVKLVAAIYNLLSPLAT
jgi:IS5 family transposase